MAELSYSSSFGFVVAPDPAAAVPGGGGAIGVAAGVVAVGSLASVFTSALISVLTASAAGGLAGSGLVAAVSGFRPLLVAGELRPDEEAEFWATVSQVWSLTQFYSVDFFAIKDRCGNSVYHAHNQGLSQLLLTVSWDLRA